MSYASGGLIQAADFNGIANGTSGANIAWVWGTGNGTTGYGQSTTALASLATGAQVTAAQWSGMLSALNGALGHQTGATYQLGPLNYTAGQTITYFANVTAAATGINQAANIAAFSSQGSTTTGSNFTANPTAAAAVAYGPATILTRTVTFASGDAARYFFNAGGQLNFVISSVTNGDSTARSSDAVTLLATNLGGFSAFRNTTGGGRTGSGGTANTNSTTIGYRNLTTSPQQLVNVTSTTSPYTTDVAYLAVQTNTTNSSGNGDFGSVITFTVNLSSPAHSAFNGTLNVTVNHRIDIVYPETTYLTSSPWGTPTVA
jgi:hypothetical protein